MNNELGMTMIVAFSRRGWELLDEPNFPNQKKSFYDGTTLSDAE
jgi:hypothetical protein